MTTDFSSGFFEDRFRKQMTRTMQIYWIAKQKQWRPGVLLLIVGEFVEVMFCDALIVCEVLHEKPTWWCTTNECVPMTGFPVGKLAEASERLSEAGNHVDVRIPLSK